MQIILVVEDLVEEQQMAKQALLALGFQAVVAPTLEDAIRIWRMLGDRIVAVLTDLHFPETVREGPKDNPCGLAAVAMAVNLGVPVAVCSNVDHHFAGYARYVLDTLETHPNYSGVGKIPFTMDRKDWNLAARELTTLIHKEGQ